MAEREAGSEEWRRLEPGDAPVSTAADVARCEAQVVERLTEDWLETWYQPKINLKRKCLAGAEAFAYLRHPDFGLLAPGEFVGGCAEDAGLASRLALVGALQSWPLFDRAGFNLSLSLKACIAVLLELPVEALVARYRPRSDRWGGLIVHVREDEIVRDVKLAREIASRLCASAVRLAIDNFGAGYSSLASLRDIPFIEIRLDRSVVQDCATDPANGAICQTAIDLAHRFGGAAAADGVKSAADLQALMAMGCDFGQGELIAPAMPQSQFLDMLRQPVTKPRPPAPSAPAPAAVAAVDRIA
jgi:EAL domain-containing protein (putative c-di-GMP-specific phosphodiesterase class I)